MNYGTINHGTFEGVGKEEIVKRSSKSKRYVSIMGLLLAVSLALLMFVGCSSNSVSNDEQNPIDPKVNHLYETGEADVNYAAPPLFEVLEVAASKVIGIAGGTVEINLSGGSAAQFSVPAGALIKPVDISLNLRKFATPHGPIFLYDCGPDGTQFKFPAKLTQPMPAGQAYAFLYYFNEDSKVWELQEVVRVKNGFATFNIKHFSKYGIS